jgi:hypothetical protein
LKAVMVAGMIVALLGLLLLVYPNIPVKSDVTTVKIGSLETRMETKKSYAVAPFLSCLLLAGGSALVLWGRLKSKS